MPYEEDKMLPKTPENIAPEPEKPPGTGPTDGGPTTADTSKARKGPDRTLVAKKIEDHLINTEDRINKIEAHFSQIPKMVEQTVIQVLQKFQEQNQKEAPSENFSNISKEDKMMMVAEFGKSLSEVISAWRGSSGSAEAGPDFKSMMAEWGMRMFSFHLDNMAQSVYQIKLPPPPDIAGRSMGPKSQPNFNMQNRPGVHKFE